MSYYGDGRASSDFCVWLASVGKVMNRAAHIFISTWCGGNIGAGSTTTVPTLCEPVLASRIYEGIVAADAQLKREPIQTVRWKTCEILPPIDPRWDEAKIMARSRQDTEQSLVNRSRPAYTVAWIRRHSKNIPIRAILLGYQRCVDDASAS